MGVIGTILPDEYVPCQMCGYPFDLVMSASPGKRTRDVVFVEVRAVFVCAECGHEWEPGR